MTDQTVVNQIWVRDGGEWREVKQCFEHRNGEWVEISKERALELSERQRIRIAALWWWIAAVAFMAGVKQLLLT